MIKQAMRCDVKHMFRGTPSLDACAAKKPNKAVLLNALPVQTPQFSSLSQNL
jgi:hypothetical protein